MLTLFNIQPPDMFQRSLTTPWMLGVFTDNIGNKDMFVVVTTNFYQNAFAGLLQWESLMIGDLKYYLASDGTVRGAFEDRIIKNKDVRVFKTAEGKVVLLYSFVNNSTIVFATKEKTLVEVLDRLEKRPFIR
jgi:hypothetical protein